MIIWFFLLLVFMLFQYFCDVLTTQLFFVVTFLYFIHAIFWIFKNPVCFSLFDLIYDSVPLIRQFANDLVEVIADFFLQFLQLISFFGKSSFKFVNKHFNFDLLAFIMVCWAITLIIGADERIDLGTFLVSADKDCSWVFNTIFALVLWLGGW